MPALFVIILPTGTLPVKEITRGITVPWRAFFFLFLAVQVRIHVIFYVTVVDLFGLFYQ